jgi:phage shock protein C
MSERTHTTQNNPDLVNYTQGDLEAALDDFLREQEPPQKVNLFNFKTIVGMGMLFVTSLFLIQQLFPWFGLTVGDQLVDLLPFIGGIMVALIGLGMFSGQKKKKRTKTKFVPTSEQTITLSDLNDVTILDNDALTQPNKLFRSGKDKRLFGVCGGIAKYFGLNPFAVRLLWAILTLSSGGVMVPLYILMVIITPKEPPMFQLPFNK